MMTVPRCAALRRDGRECGALASSPTATFCRRHEQLVIEHGEQAVTSGRYPRRRKPRLDTALVVETEPRSSNGARITPAEIRPRLAQKTAESVTEIEQSLLDAALGATREHWTTFTCPDCGKKHRAQVQVPDVRARISAVELLLRESLGRVPQSEEAPTPRLPDSPAAVERLSWSDQQRLADVFLAEQITAVRADGGETLIRERVASLSESGDGYFTTHSTPPRIVARAGGVAGRLFHKSGEQDGVRLPGGLAGLIVAAYSGGEEVRERGGHAPLSVSRLSMASLRALLVSLLVALGLAASASAATGASRRSDDQCPVPVAPFVQPASRPHYSLSLRVAPDLRSVTGSETVSFTPDLATDRLVFRLWPNADFYAKRGARLTVGRVVAGKQMLSVSYPDPTTLVVDRPLAAGESITVSMDWSLALPTGPGLRLHGGSSLRLGTFFPMLAWEPGVGWALDPGPRRSIGETWTSPAADFDVRVNTPRGLTVLASGEQVGAGHWRATAVRDFAEIFDRDACGDSGIAEEDVELFVCLDRLGDHPCAVCHRGNVTVDNVTSSQLV